MDVVYVNKNGENPELRYSLRSLSNVAHDKVFVIGGAPSWLNSDHAVHLPRAQKATSYSSTRALIKAACVSPEVSDPFQLWNDDFYAMRWIGELPIYHRGSVEAAIEKFATTKTPWAKGLRETARLLEMAGVEEPMFYDTHIPLVVDKSRMLAALGWSDSSREDAVHVRTLYGNLWDGIGGVYHEDPKMLSKIGPFPEGSWLSSGDNTYRNVIEPVLRYHFPNPSIYEKDV